MAKRIGNNELLSNIKETQTKNIEAAGLVPICTTKNPSHTSINNYKAVLASQSSLSITTTAISKKNHRYTVENSLISAMVFLVVVASTHFILVNEENDETRRVGPDINAQKEPNKALSSGRRTSTSNRSKNSL